MEKFCSALLESDNCTIRQVSQVVGNLVTTELGVPAAPMHYKCIECFKAKELKGNSEAVVTLPDYVHDDLKSWLNNLQHQIRHLMLPSPTDASSI